MATSHKKLIADVEYYKRMSEHWREEFDKLRRSNNALRGQIKKLKNASAKTE